VSVLSESTIGHSQADKSSEQAIKSETRFHAQEGWFDSAPDHHSNQKLAAGMESLTRAVVELALLPEKQFAESSRLRRLHFNSDGLPHQKRSG